ncbi:MAG: hypothetical protein WB681_00565 [Candidatus Cybelea sp.]
MIGALILAEWAASAWLASATHTTSAIVGMVVALGLGISLWYIHLYVERFVDRVFFRRRHEDEAALCRFAHEASYISDRSTLVERAVQTVKEFTSARTAQILVRDGVAAYAFATDGPRADVSENDPGIVALRAWNKPINLHVFPDSQLRGEFAFPMISCGDLVGGLICGPKRDGEAYSPDESEALLAGSRAWGRDGARHRAEPKEWSHRVDTRDASADAARASEASACNRERVAQEWRKGCH